MFVVFAPSYDGHSRRASAYIPTSCEWSSFNKSHSVFQFKMAGFLRGKQAGIQNDLSAGILPGLFAPDDRARFGINSQVGYGSPSTVYKYLRD
jgi:hypothetical protein